MGDGFANAIIGGAEELIRSGMRSENYAAGSMGWRVGRNGDAEFNGGTFRGTVVIGSMGSQITITDVIPPELEAFYVTSGVFSELSTAVIQIEGGDGSYTYFIGGHNSIVPFTAWAIGIVYSDGTVLQQLNGSYFPATGVSQLDLGNTDDDFRTVTQGFANLLGMEVNGGATFNAALFANGNLTVDSTLSGADINLINGAALEMDSQSDLNFNGVSLGRGVIYFEEITTGHGSAASTAEQLWFATAATMTLPPGRAFHVRLRGVYSSAAAQAVQINIRKTNLAGTVLVQSGRTNIITVSANTQTERDGVFINSTGSPVTVTLAITVTPGAATIVNWGPAALPVASWIEVVDVGSTAKYTGVSV